MNWQNFWMMIGSAFVLAVCVFGLLAVEQDSKREDPGPALPVAGVFAFSLIGGIMALFMFIGAAANLFN